MSFEREELWGIRERANDQSNVTGLNPDWRRTYEALASAADHLDAMIARTEVTPDE